MLTACAGWCAQVVVTSYEVLRQEVYYSPENRILGALRHKKRYRVPESPLLQVSSCGTSAGESTLGHRCWGTHSVFHTAPHRTVNHIHAGYTMWHGY